MNDIPKVELHVHLDGSVRPETVSEILNMNLEEVKENMIAPITCKDLNDYLTKFDLPVLAMQTSSDLERIAYELTEDLKKDNVIYAEVRFAPLKHTKNGLTKEEVIESILKGLKKGDIPTKLILCCMRNDSIEENLKVIDLALKYKGDVVAVDLAGAEALYKTSSFKTLFEVCNEKSIPFTIHAGEADGYDSIKSAIDFGAKRLGHGVLSIDYPELLEEIKENNILLEVCPTSNIQTNIYKTINEHPISELFKKGVSVCINTDNRTVSNVTLSEEYNSLKEKFSYLDFCKMNLDAIEHSFLNIEEKKILKKKIEQYMEDFNK